MFATDRDLLEIEPNLLRDVGWAGQRLVAGVGTVSGTTLTISSYDVTFEAAGVGAGHVVVVDGVTYEVVARLTATTATLSRLRASVEDAVIPPSAVSGKGVAVWTFGPQIAAAHAAVVRMAGLRAGAAGAPAEPGEQDIKNAGELRRLEALAALEFVLTAAAGPGGDGSALRERAEQVRRRFDRERQGAVVELDLDGDGVADARRRLNLINLVRG